MGCGLSKANPSTPLKKKDTINKYGGSERNKSKTEMLGVVTVAIGKLEGFLPKNHKLQCIISWGAQTFKSASKKGSAELTWEDSCHIWVSPEQTKNKVLIAIYEDYSIKKDSFLAGNLVSIEALTSSPTHTLDISIDLFPENITHGQVYDASESLGKFHCSASIQKTEELKRAFWESSMRSVDVDADGRLDKEEFKELISVLQTGEKDRGVPQEDAERIFKEIDFNQDNFVDVKELTEGLANKNLVSNYSLYEWAIENWVNSNEGVGGMKGGYVTASHAGAGFAFQTSEWLGMKDYSEGLNTGYQASFILVKNRETGMMVQEKISQAVNLAMRTMYQTVAGRAMLWLPSTTEAMRKASELAGSLKDKPASADEIPGFVKTFALNMTEVAEPLENFKSFNDFFMRKLKPEARPIHEPSNPKRAIQPADARVVAFESVSRAQELWIKSKKFSLQRLLGDSFWKDFDGGSLVISRLAPQDYHRFHSPVDGCVASISPIMGKQFWTVNPLAINSPVPVFSENIRRVNIIDSTEFGKVAFVCVGATMVGSIVFSDIMKEGSKLNKGDDLGSYKFGGSTCITVFQKGRITFDADLLENTGKHLETLVKMGTSLGVAS